MSWHPVGEIIWWCFLAGIARGLFRRRRRPAHPSTTITSSGIPFGPGTPRRGRVKVDGVVWRYTRVDAVTVKLTRPGWRRYYRERVRGKVAA